jgi:hypothetical protein
MWKRAKKQKDKRPRLLVPTRLYAGGPLPPEGIDPPKGPAGDVPVRRSTDDRQPT